MKILAESVPEFERALLSLDRLAARAILEHSMDASDPVGTVETLIVPSLERIGLGWEQGRVALSQVYMSGRICEDLVDTILPPASQARKDQPHIAIVVFHDYHFLGKRIVYSMLRAGGWELSDFGRMETDELISRIQKDGVDVLLMSTLMLPSALRIRDFSMKVQTLTPDVKIVVGGAPFRFDDRLWKEVGAHAQGRDAAEAVQIVNTLSGGAP